MNKQSGFSLVEIIIAAGIAILVLGGGFYLYTNVEPTTPITNYEFCANAEGSVIMESYPEQCRTAGGQIFTRILTDEERARLEPQEEILESPKEIPENQSENMSEGLLNLAAQNCLVGWPEVCDTDNIMKLYEGTVVYEDNGESITWHGAVVDFGISNLEFIVHEENGKWEPDSISSFTCQRYPFRHKLAEYCHSIGVGESKTPIEVAETYCLSNGLNCSITKLHERILMADGEFIPYITHTAILDLGVDNVWLVAYEKDGNWWISMSTRFGCGTGTDEPTLAEYCRSL